MKQFENREHLNILTAWVVFFLLLLPMDLAWTPAFLMIKASVNAVSALVYAGVLSALWNRRGEPVEHGGLLFVLVLVTLPYLLLLPVFYYSGLVCAVVSAGLAAALFVDLLRSRGKKNNMDIPNGK